MKRPVKYRKKKYRINVKHLLLLILAAVVAVGLLVVSGIAIAKLIGSASGKNDPQPGLSTDAQTQDGTAAQTDTVPDTSESTTAPEEETTAKPISVTRPTGVSSTDHFRGLMFDLSAYDSLDALRTDVTAAAEKGYTAAVFLAKTEQGRLTYASGVKKASEVGASAANGFNPAEVIKVFHDSGMFVTARLYGFRDNTASGADEAMALKKQGGIRWSDGTSRWLSVYSADACSYLCDLASELDAAGADEISMVYFGLPNTNETALIAYDGDDHKAAVTAFAAQLKCALSYASLTFEASGSAIAAGSSATTGLDLAAQLASCDAFVANITEETVTPALRTAAGTYAVRLLCNAKGSYEDDVFCGSCLTGKYGS